MHYRILDVSSVNLVVRSVNPKLFYKKNKQTHRAVDDIRESINELKYKYSYWRFYMRNAMR